MPPAARITDPHVCPMVTVLVPHVGGPIALGEFTVLTGKLPQSRITDIAVCVGPPDMIAKGSAGVLVGKLPAARMGDLTAHGGVIVKGEFTVMIGEAGSGGGGGMTPPGIPIPGLEGAGAELAKMLDALLQTAKDGAPFDEQCLKLP